MTISLTRYLRCAHVQPCCTADGSVSISKVVEQLSVITTVGCPLSWRSSSRESKLQHGRFDSAQSVILGGEGVSSYPEAVIRWIARIWLHPERLVEQVDRHRQLPSDPKEAIEGCLLGWTQAGGS